jgi:DNA-binding NarL/FixJ family response regulator
MITKEIQTIDHLMAPIEPVFSTNQEFFMPVSPEQRKARILVVAKQSRIRDGLRALLEALPEIEFVDLAGDAPMARQAAEISPPDLILWDAEIPFSANAGLCEQGPPFEKVPCIVLTEGWPSRQYQDCCDVLLKGFSTEDLYRVVRRLLGPSPAAAI